MVETNQTQIGIAGAGLVGRVLALNLVQQGCHDYKVTLFDQDTRHGEQAAGLTAAGMLAPFAELETAESSVFESGQRSIELWPDLLKQINIPEAFQQMGSLITAHRADMPDLIHFVNQLKSKVTLAQQIETLDSKGIQALEPELTQHTKAFYLPSEAQVNAQEFMAASAKYLLNHPQVIWHESQSVTGISSGKIQTKLNSYEFDWVFDARGLGAKSDVNGLRGGLRGVRGEVFWLDAPEVNLTRPIRLMHPRYRIYIVPRPNHRYVVGATEIESEDKSPMSVRSSLELLSAVYSVHSGFGEARIVNMLTNCRPAMANNLPIIEQGDKFTLINGLYRHGYLLAPAVVEKALLGGLNENYSK